MGADFKLQPYDRFYYSAKMKKARLNLSEDEVKTYFNIDSVQVNGVFYAAHRVYGLNFKERKDLPTRVSSYMFRETEADITRWVVNIMLWYLTFYAAK